MNLRTARQLITERIEALAVSTDYADATFALDGIAWAEAAYPLLPELPPVPDTLTPLAFFVDLREEVSQGGRSGHDNLFVRATAVVRFVFPLREHGPPVDDLDRASAAHDALVDQLLDPTWAESAGDGGLSLAWDVGQRHGFAPVLDGTLLLWECPFTVLFDRST